MSFSDESVISKCFELVDGTGTVKARLYTLDDMPRLDLFGADELPRVTITVEDDRPLISLLSSDGKSLLGIGVSKENENGLMLASSDGELRLLMAVHDSGDAAITLWNHRREVIWSAPHRDVSGSKFT
jgi:hypothetical protein